MNDLHSPNAVQTSSGAYHNDVLNSIEHGGDSFAKTLDMKQTLLLILLFIGVNFSKFYAQNIIALWNYNSITGAPLTPIADIGTGTSQAIGSMVVTNAATGMDPIINNGCGSQNGTNPGAWAFSPANPGASNESSGVEFMASTIGSSNIHFTWDQRWSNTATNTVRVQYTTDGFLWNNFVMDNTNTTFCNGSIDNGRFQNNGAGDQYRRISVDFSSIPAVNNNSNFGVRILAAHYQATGEFRQTSNPASIATAGTWRFDNVRIEGKANVSIVSASNFAQYDESIGSIVVPITVSNANSSQIDLVFSLSTYTDATVNDDFTWSENLSIPANTNGVFDLPLTIIDDVVAENAERIIVKISSGTNAKISSTNYYQIIFIKDNDYQAPAPTNELNLSLLTSFSNGAAGSNSAEIVTFDPEVDRLYLANSIAQKLDIIDFSDPSNPSLISSISLTPYGNINSVVAHDSIVALAIESIPAQDNGKVVFMDYNGNFINEVEVGAMPDMIIFNKDYSKLLTANEGEPDATYSVDPEGSVSIIDLAPGYAALTNANVTNLDFTAFNGQEAALIAQGIRIFSTSASVAQDLEPEYIAISDDNLTAYVTLQENNALLTIDLTSNTIVSLTALGYGSYDALSGNALDASDQSGAVLITGNLPIKATYMPDAMDYYTVGGTGYLVMANEGDSREFGSVEDAKRISSSTFNNLDPIAFPDKDILRNNKFLGRLSALQYSGDFGNDGDYDELHVMGGRSFSIRDASTGALVFDSKALFEQILAQHPQFNSIFNASNSTGVPSLKNRSDDKGPEPEGVEVAEIDGNMYAFIGLERIGGVMMFNINNPLAPVYVGYANNRSTVASGPDLGTEGIIFISADQSPNGQALVILANEVSSTLSIYQINTCAELSGAPIVADTLTICDGDMAELSASIVPSVTYAWLQDGTPILNANSNEYETSVSGDFSLALFNADISCVDTSNVLTITVNPLPNVTTGGDQEVCEGFSVVLSGSGAESYLWDNGVTDGLSFVPMATQDYTVTGTDINGCVNTAELTVTVNASPTVSAGLDQTVCSGTDVTLSGSGASDYDWSHGVLDGVAFTATSTATYELIGTDDQGCADTAEVTVTILDLPIVSLGADTIVCEYNFPVVIDAVGDAGLDYSWSNGASGMQNTISTAGNYIVTVTDNNDCSSTDEIEVISDACASLTEEDLLVEIYPNPFGSTLHLRSTEYLNANIELLALDGRLITQANMNGQNMQLDFSSIASGTYIIYVSANGKVYQTKVIKQ